MNCRHCNASLELLFVDLGSAPPSNAYLSPEKLRAPEVWYPLRLIVCEKCWLVQTEDFARAEQLFDANYAYFSSFSGTWLTHAKCYVETMAERFGLNASSHVVEIAANDGYLLQYVKEMGIPCTGIEPTHSTAEAARVKGIPVIEDFFGLSLAEALVSMGQQADLMVANNVLAHVPDINDFVSGFAKLLNPAGVATFEFPHLLRLIGENQFDTIYHEHFSYLSLISVQRIFNENGLNIFDVEELSTHGGSLRVYAQRCDEGREPLQGLVNEILVRERLAKLDCAEGYMGFQTRANRIKNDLLEFLLDCDQKGLQVAAYGAAAKGNTLLNYAGVRADLLPYVVDRNPAKQGRYLPGSRIPIVCEERLKELKPDRILLLPWNLKQELIYQLDYAHDWDAKFVTAIPELDII